MNSSETDPSFENDYGRAEIGGSQGPIVWESLLRGDGLAGWEVGEAPWTPTAWSRDGDTLIADVGDGHQARLVQGDTSWWSYEYKVQTTILKGNALQLHFSISEDRHEFYFLACLMGWKASALIKQHGKDEGDTKLDVDNFSMEYDREYDMVVAVRGNSMVCYIDGKAVNRLSVATQPMGGVGMAVMGNGAIARFRDPKIRHYFRKKH